MNRFRLGEDPSKFAYEAKPKKKIRGCVPNSYSLCYIHTNQYFCHLDGVLQFKMASAFAHGGSNKLDMSTDVITPIRTMSNCNNSTFINCYG
jgi:hypothetical protein